MISEYLFLKITRRKIQIVLGLLWLLDGALQLQHQMFTANFANDVIAPAALGQPLFVRGPIHFAIHIFMLHPAIFNTLIAVIQLGLGILILWKRTAKFGLIASMFWGLFVWYIGEGLGGLATGQTILLMGAPGAALLYAVIAAGVMPRGRAQKQTHHSANWLAIVWAILWLGGAALQLLNGQNSGADLSAMITGMTSGAPGWLSALDLHAAHLVASAGSWSIVGLVIVQALIGLLIFLSRSWRFIAVALGALLSIVFWVVGQGLGGYYSGLATDPSTAPLIILLGIAILGSRELGRLELWGT